MVLVDCPHQGTPSHEIGLVYCRTYNHRDYISFSDNSSILRDQRSISLTGLYQLIHNFCVSFEGSNEKSWPSFLQRIPLFQFRLDDYQVWTRSVHFHPLFMHTNQWPLRSKLPSLSLFDPHHSLSIPGPSHSDSILDMPPFYPGHSPSSHWSFPLSLSLSLPTLSFLSSLSSLSIALISHKNEQWSASRKWKKRESALKLYVLEANIEYAKVKVK